MGQARVTQAGVYTELGGPLIEATQVGVYVEITIAKVSVTQVGVYIEVLEEGNRPPILTLGTVGSYAVRLTWELPEKNEPTLGYELQRSPLATDDWQTVYTGGPSGLTVVDTPLAPATGYRWRIRALYPDEEEPGDSHTGWSSVVSTTTLARVTRDYGLRFFLLQPQTILAAQVNLPSATYPLLTIPFDTVTSEDSPIFVQPGMTLLLGSAPGLDDYGRQRVKRIEFPDWPSTATGILHVGRSSYGNFDGELMVHDDAYITVLWDFRVWSKIAYIYQDGTIFKDGDVLVSDRTTTPPPKANAGAPAVGTVDAATGVFTTVFPPVSGGAFATAEGASIASYAWWLPDGVALAVGSNLTDAQITVEADPGFHWLAQTVIDSNGKQHTQWTWVLAIDPSAPVDIPGFQVTDHTITHAGQDVTVRVLDDIPAATYPDGTLAVLWEGEPSDVGERDNLIFWGWHESDPAQIVAQREGTLKDTELRLTDVGGRLRSLPGFSVAVANDAKRTAGEPSITWAYMVNPTMDRFLHYLLHWHSTALEVANWVWSGTGDAYAFTILEASGDSLWDQVDRKARSLVPNYRLTCDRLGRLAVRADQLMLPVADRTATVQADIAVADWSSVRYDYDRRPRIHWLRENAILADAEEVAAVFCIAPGDAPGQGESDTDVGEQLALTQAALNVNAGLRYARLNAALGMVEVTLATGDHYDLDLARMEWVTLTVAAGQAAQRGLVLDGARGVVHELRIDYRHSRAGLARTTTLRWERETSGPPAVTVIPPDIGGVDDGNDAWPDTPGDTSPDAWWLQGGIEAASCVGAYRAHGVTDLASSYVNLANPGTNDLAVVTTAPEFAEGGGWTFLGEFSPFRNLTTGLVPAAGWTMIVAFSGCVSGLSRTVAGVTSGEGARFSIEPREDADYRHYYAGGYRQAAGAVAAGVMAVAGQQGYLDGVADGDAIPAWSGSNTHQLMMGGLNDGGGFGSNPFLGTVTHMAVYDATLTGEQVAAVTAAIEGHLA